MTLQDILTVARRTGIVLEAEGEHLVVDAPAGAITPDLRAALVAHKPALLAVLAPPQRFVTLKGGPTVPEDALRLALDLEARGLPLQTTPDGEFIIPDDSRLTDADHAAMGRWRQHLGAIVNYRAPEVG